MPAIYALLGTPDSGHLAILSDLTEYWLESEDCTVHLATLSGDPSLKSNVPQSTYDLATDNPPTLFLTFPPLNPQDALFLIAPQNDSPLDFLEALSLALQKKSIEIAGIITTIDCRLASQQAGLKPWYDTYLHFSDVLLLNHRGPASQSWEKALEQRIKKEHMPCLIQGIKKGHVANPALILEPTPRRLSQAFDIIPQDEQVPDHLEIIIEDGEDPHSDIDEEDSLPPEPYFARNAGGQRMQKLPPLAQYLPQE